MKTLLPIFGLLLAFSLNRAGAQSVTITGQTAGPTPFIAQIQLSANPPASVKSIKFQITPKPGSVTRPVSATYSIEYLQKRGYFNAQTGAILVPVFGLYANFSNTVTLTYQFTNNTSQQASVMVSTPAFSSTCGYNTPTVVQARTNSTTLSYDYFLIRNLCGTAGPIIVDTDGQVRWIGTAGVANHSTILFQNSIYLGTGPKLYRIELDGTFALLKDYTGGSLGVTNFHHNADIGKRGLLMEADTTTQVEAVVMEVDGLGNLLKSWNMADIISGVMLAGGDNPSLFVRTASDPAPTNDWFHMNASAYKKSDDSLLVSSRENFVIALDYNTSAIKWILGDENKKWHQFPSLATFSLAPGAGTLAPVGQHAVSLTLDDNLLLFDNGRSSNNHVPAGVDRSYSVPRKYQINIPGHTATQLWSYEAGQVVYSPFCSSVYEDSSSNYLVDYAILDINEPQPLAEILGLDASGLKIFHYRYPTTSCNAAYNSVPVHFENMTFGIMTPPVVATRKMHGTSGMFDVALPLTGNPGVESRSAGANGAHQIVATFAVPVTVTGATVTPGSNGTASIDGAPIVNGRTVTVNLTNVSNAQKLTINLIGVNDGTTTENVSIPMNVLKGDVTGNGIVNSTDVSDVKLHAGSTVNGSNFRRDIATTGQINSTDLSIVKLAVGTAIP